MESPKTGWAVALTNSLTFANAVSGFAAILFLVIHPAVPGEWPPGLVPAATLIFVAYAFDGIDGVVARRLGVAGPSGAMLDSLCDVVSFGIAPAIMLVVVAGSAWPGSVLVIAALLVAISYLLAVIFRLSRYTIAAILPKTAPPSFLPKCPRVFAGMPSPAAAMILAACALLVVDRQGLAGLETATFAAPSMVIAGLVAAILMVSRLPFLDLVNSYLRGMLPPWHLAIFAATVLLIGPAPALVLLGAVYSITGLSQSWRYRQPSTH
jgi:CDP-diacylglycerol--serine O-phosphatidyltransferase